MSMSTPFTTTATQSQNASTFDIQVPPFALKPSPPLLKSILQDLVYAYHTKLCIRLEAVFTKVCSK